MVDEKKGSQWQIWIAGLILTLFAAYMGVQWQTQHDAIKAVEGRSHEMFITHEQDIERLDESNRSRRIEIGEINARLATLEERTK
ncbi:unnamed protein product [marine sediment metagenome]|uniref:Uncharacterized protein n=1 Tax=marine sediment metagenome TaxID=412755 RepID=X0XMY3_9ZZZZ